jgi:hypothetical protein
MDQAMNYGAKVSKGRYEVGEPDAPPKGNEQPDDNLKFMVSSFGIAFVFGAKLQIERYKTAYAAVKYNAQIGTLSCLHEALTLLEDLDTLSWYTQKCGSTHPLNKTIRNMRNHARHDIRENINDESNEGRKKRAKQLGIHQNLMVHIGFDADAIKMGTTILTLEAVAQYIDWAATILNAVIANGVRAGRINGVSLI